MDGQEQDYEINNDINDANDDPSESDIDASAMDLHVPGSLNRSALEDEDDDFDKRIGRNENSHSVEDLLEAAIRPE